MKFSKLYFLPLFLFLVFSFSACGKKEQVQNQNNDVVSDNIADESLDNEESYFSSSVEEMFKKGKSLQCTVDIEDEEATMSAVYYFDNKNERVRVEMKAVGKGEGMSFNSTSIIRDDWTYFWDDLMNKDGMKMKMDDESDESYDSNDNTPSTKDEFDFKCKSWKVDSSKFDIPKDKSFKDISDMNNQFNNLGNSNPSLNNNQANDLPSVSNSVPSIDVCSYCEMIPAGEDRDECLTSCK